MDKRRKAAKSFLFVVGAWGFRGNERKRMFQRLHVNAERKRAEGKHLYGEEPPDMLRRFI